MKISNEHWPYNLLTAVESEYGIAMLCADCPVDLELAIQYLLECTLQERECRVITAYYKNGLTHREIGSAMLISTERVRQIKRKSIRKLRHPSRLIFIRYGLKGGLAYFMESRYAKAYSDGYRVRYAEDSGQPAPARSDPIDQISEPVDILSGTIYELGLGVRAYNALRRANINTIEQLLEKTPEDLRRIRNVGAKTVTEILAALEFHGYEMSSEKTE